MSRIFDPVKPDVHFPTLEKEILDFWDKNQIFSKTLEPKNPDGSVKKPYSFYDGPPFVTGLPHYGHLLAGTLKDIVPRYWTMRGYHIPRRFGWDCHGVPVEFEVNKKLKLSSRKDILNFGVANYNNACRDVVNNTTDAWYNTVRRMGRWVDMDNAYHTMDLDFMQSVWWVFQTLYNKGLIYEGYKVVPYSTGLSTVLSNFEAGQDYRDVQDPAITVTFPLVDASGKITDVSFLAWTTTPWTLPSNMGLAVGPDVDYVKVREKATGKVFILAESRLSGYSKDPFQDFEVFERMKGSALVGLEYQPLFNYFAAKKSEGAFKVIPSAHVTTDTGTGIVHMAPAYGEDDFFACKAAGVPLVNPVDDDGLFTSEIPDFVGRSVKEADKDIIAKIKAEGRLYKHETLMHSYPFCERSGTPLIYRAVSSWFVSVEKIKEEIIANNKKTKWVPEHLRDGRFGKWLENARDWAISRNRFWGTPLPIWRNAEGEIVCIGSIEELEKLAGVKVTDLHKEFVDAISIPSPSGGSPLKRIDPVLDCWFESGSMPYAQRGYPFTNKAEFEASFPAEFIAEGIDQTRGWFYTLMIIGTGVSGNTPFKNVVVNGTINAEDGKKMSKRLKNYPDPEIILNEHGADALRLYLIDSPVVKGEDMRFSEKGVKDTVRKILLRWWNSYSFFVSYANVDEFVPRGDFAASPNILDQWVLSRLNHLIKTTNKEMEAYRLYNVVPELLNFIEELTNTYIRFNRNHFWKNGMPEDKRFAYETLFHVLTTLSKIMAPFAPFLAETMYRNLAKGLPGATTVAAGALSVHLEDFPKADVSLIKPDLESAVSRMENLMFLGRTLREKLKIKAKIPLLSMKLIHRDQRALDQLKKLESYFQEELNIRKFEYISAEEKYVQVSAKANFPILGKRVGAKMKSIAAAIGKFTLAQIEELELGKEIIIDGESVSLSDVEIRRGPLGENPNLATHQWISIEVDPTLHEDQIQEGLAREVMRKVQQSRKNADLNLDDRIHLGLELPADLLAAVKIHEATLKEEALVNSLVYGPVAGGHAETVDLDEGQIKISFKRAV